MEAYASPCYKDSVEFYIGRKLLNEKTLLFLQALDMLCNAMYVGMA
jgi:hypothetical protein